MFKFFLLFKVALLPHRNCLLTATWDICKQIIYRNRNENYIIHHGYKIIRDDSKSTFARFSTPSPPLCLCMFVLTSPPPDVCLFFFLNFQYPCPKNKNKTKTKSKKDFFSCVDFRKLCFKFGRVYFTNKDEKNGFIHKKLV